MTFELRLDYQTGASFARSVGNECQQKGKLVMKSEVRPVPSQTVTETEYLLGTQINDLFYVSLIYGLGTIYKNKIRLEHVKISKS